MHPEWGYTKFTEKGQYTKNNRREEDEGQDLGFNVVTGN